MKFAIIALAILGSTSSAFAAADCAAGAKKLYSCTSAPQAGNSEAISDTFDSLAICEEGDKTVMVAEKSGESDALPVHVISRPGGVSYEMVIPEATIALNLPAGLSPSVKTVTGKLSVDFNGLSGGSSTYTCEIVR